MPYYKVDQPNLYMDRIRATAEHMAATYTNYEYLGPDPTHQTEFSPKELYDSFTTDEALLALMSSNPAVVAQAQLLTVNRGVTVSASDAGYQSAIDLLETEGVLTADRAADYRNGIPLE
jgi:hypothetical protein